MSNILGNVSYKYTLGSEMPIEYTSTTRHWQNREIKHTNRKWRELSSKMFKRDK